MLHEFDSWTEAREVARDIARGTNAPVAIFKPFNSDSYALAIGEQRATLAFESENFVEWVQS